MKSKKPIETSLKAQSERYVSVGLAAGGFEGVDDDNNRKISNTAFAPLKFNICLGWNCQESTGFFVAKQADLHNLSRLFLFFFSLWRSSHQIHLPHGIYTDTANSNYSQKRPQTNNNQWEFVIACYFATAKMITGDKPATITTTTPTAYVKPQYEKQKLNRTKNKMQKEKCFETLAMLYSTLSMNTIQNAIK